ncbi:AAA family ATPase [Dehalobacter restrictus]|uniref:AAA family ATPase n=1 Tax=Dehalobacter restrictus TaxID=55583 RepID=A0A857DM26_9FIRM|nr:AAA family ATPase [Dehalobacter restrictus]QHA01459.1 AAA family ATPase [Dehalobacter restrictus]
MSQNKLITMDAESLLTTPLPPTRFIVSELIPQGVHILAGAPKVGKSWLALQICLWVASGESLWSFPVTTGTVLYLCLEDSFTRIQNRLFDITDEAPDNLHFATMSEIIGEGLENQIEDFLNVHTDMVLIVIDTLQRIRKVSTDANPYASDYRDIGILKQLADKHRIAILLIHHLRKMNDDDPMNMISGTTGISGATDSNFVLKKDKRSGNAATLYCVGRDIEYRELQLEFDKTAHLWNLLSDSITDEPQPSDEIIIHISAVMESLLSFTGTATELADEIEKMCGAVILPNVLIKKVIRNQAELAERGIAFEMKRTHDRKEINILYERVGCDGNDGKTDTVSVLNLPTQPSQPTQDGGAT